MNLRGQVWNGYSKKIIQEDVYSDSFIIESIISRSVNFFENIILHSFKSFTFLEKMSVQ